MAKGFRPVMRDQPMLLPVDLREWLPPDHLVWFVIDTVAVLDTSGLEQHRRVGGAGTAGYDPAMLLALLVYAYCGGVRSSRRIEQLCLTDVAYRVLCGQQGPDHATIARFRVDCSAEFAGLFSQVLQVAAKLGMARFATVAIDGTKIAANASIDANRGREWFDAQAAAMITDADQVDQAEQEATPDPDRVPAGLVGCSRAARIRQAAAELSRRTEAEQRADAARQASALERRRRAEAGEGVVGRIPAGRHRLAEARAHLARETAAQQAKLDRRAAIIAAGRKPMGAPPRPVEEHSHVVRARKAVEAALAAEQVTPTPNLLPDRVANITDPHSRVMPTRRGFLQGYNVQVAVTADQMIAAIDVVQTSSDIGSFIPMMTKTVAVANKLHRATGSDAHHIGVVLADAGYASNANLAAAGPDRLIALGKGRDHHRGARRRPATGPPPAGATPRQAMDHRLRTAEGAATYKKRAATVEPGIGNLKKILDRFSRRGLTPALHEAQLAATAFNITKLHRATR
ncbi:MAG: transposase [Micropruina sp.]|nr:transposase [Micropruina sp.]